MTKKKKTKRQPPQKMDYEAIRARDKERKLKKREQTRGKRKKILKITGITAAAAAVLCAAGFGGYQYLKRSGWILRHKIAMKSEHFEVTDAMLACYFQQCVESYQAYAEQDTNAVKLDTGKSLKKQEYTDGYTFYDMLMEKTEQTIEAQIQVCEAAYAAGYELSEEKKESCRTIAAERDLSLFQKGVSREDIRKSVELTMLAQEFEADAIDSISVSDEELQAYFEQHRDEYVNVDIYGFTFPYDTEDSETDYGMTHEEALSYAEELSACKTADAFSGYVENYLRDVKKSNDEEIRLNLDNLRSTNLASYFSSEVQEWVKSDDAKKYATLMTDREEQNIVQVCMLLNPPAPSEEQTVNIRVVVLTTAEFDGADGAKEFAQELIAQCEEAGGTPEAFAELAYEYSSDVFTYPNGGVVSGMTPSRTTYGEELPKWAFDKSRKAGDMGIVEGSGTVILAYFESASEDNGWQSLVREAFTEQVKEELNKQNHQAEVTKYPENYKYITG